MLSFNQFVFRVTFIVIYFCITVSSLKADKKPCSGNIPKIAIVGGGIGGAATAFFLSELINEGEICIDLYEAKEVGGRLSEVQMNGARFDSGGCVIHGSNLYMKYFVNKLGFKKRAENLSTKFGFYNGERFVFIDSSWNIFSYVKVFFRYGFGFYYIYEYVNYVINSFKRIYDYQDDRKTFNDMESFLKILNEDFVKYLQVSIKNGLLERDLQEGVIDEIVGAGIITNYGQSTNVHQFVGTVSMAGMDSTLWTVEGGQSQIPKGLIRKSGANLILAKVDEIHLNEDNTFSLLAENVTTIYDFVVIAAPLTSDAIFPIVFKNFPHPIHVPGQYHRTVATIVHGKLNHTNFGFNHARGIPNFIVNVGNAFFNSISKIRQVNSNELPMEDIWKVFSQQPLSSRELQDLFYERRDVQVVDWLAYPHYNTSKRDDKVILFERLYYLNAIEWLASAMEMSSISAKNIALLVFHKLYPEKPDYSEEHTHKDKQNDEHNFKDKQNDEHNFKHNDKHTDL